MRAVFEVMGGEPWCFTPEQIGRLTDRQVWEQYVRPALRKYRRPGRKRRKRPGRTGDGVPTREAFVEMGAAMVPGSGREHWEREWDQWAASDEGRRFLAARAARKKR